MSQCVYTYHGPDGEPIKFESYNDLIEYLDKNNSLEQISDLIFSKGDRQQITISKLEAIAESTNGTSEFTTNHSNMLDGGEDISAPAGSFTTQTFIDSGYFLVAGEAPTFRLSTEDYVETMKRSFVKEETMTKEQAEAWGGTVQEKWDGIAKNAKDFHKFIMMPHSDIEQEWVLRTYDSAFYGVADKVMKAEKEIFKKVMMRNGKDHQGIRNDSYVKKGLSLEAELKNMSEKIFGHIDYVVVRDNGDIELFLVKTSTEPYTQWADAKLEKYKYQAALLKRMLAHKGIDTRFVRLNLIPVQIKYNDAMDTVVDIEVQDPEALDRINSRYVFQEYDHTAAQFIDDKIDMDNIDQPKVMQDVSAQLQHILPGLNITAEGVTQTAKDWVEKHWKYCNPRTTTDGGWTLTLPNKEVVTVSDARARSKNSELVSIIAQKLRESTLPYSGRVSAHFLKGDIENSFRHGFLSFESRMTSASSTYLHDQFSKYFSDQEPTASGHIRYKWELIDHPILDEANIICLKHRDTGQLDVFTISSSSPGATFSFKGRKNLLGAYLTDMNNKRFTMQATYGNAEAIRTMALLNEILPELGGDIKLGQLRVIGMNEFTAQQGAFFEFDYLLSEWDTILKVVNNNTPAGITNNFKEQNVQCIPLEQVLRQTWLEVINDNGIRDLAEIKGLGDVINQKAKPDGTMSESLLTISTIEGKIAKLETLQARLRDLCDRNGVDYRNAKKLIQTSEGMNKTRSALAKLYIITSQALNRYYGDDVSVDEKFSSLQALGLKTTSIGNTNVRRVGYLVQRSIDNMRATILDTYMPGAMQIFKEYYEDCGYGKVQNALINNQETLYRNLYQPDEQGNNTFLFKNPYDPDSDLKPHERKFLKKILWEFYKVRQNMKHHKEEFDGPDDPSLVEKMPKNYLYAPLQKASVATKRLHLKENLKQFGKNVHRFITRPGEVSDELAEANQGFLSIKEAEQRDKSISDLRVYNRYTYTNENLDARDRYINTKGTSYFETNIENIFIDFLSEQVRVDEFNKLLMRIKAIELALTMKGIAEGDDEGVNHTIETIDDFITVNIFNKSIMEKTNQKIDAFLSPLRRLVSTFYVSANPVGEVRDILQGLQENFFQAAIKYQTDVSMADVAFGYAMVFKDSLTSMSQMSLLNQINIKNGFSNFDAAKVAERLKTGRGGVLNPEHWMYWTLRAPDYLNRMVLFVAKARHDGVWPAYSLDEKGRLVYDWKKDTRFDQLAAGNTSHADYNTQKSLYYSLIRQFNLETGSNLSYTDNLPDGYTPGQIRAIKTLGESIYGAYDNASKAMYENMAIGRNFAFFSTWMNGIVDNYAKPRQISQSELSWEQEEDYNGNKLFFTADNSGNTTTEDTGIPVYANVPIMVQGIFQTFGQFWSELRDGGWDFKQAATDVWSSEINRRNIKRAFGDMLVALLLAWMFKHWITPAYKKHKAEDDGRNVVSNVVTEWIYKASYSSFDTFKGPYAVLTYIGDSTNPATYKLQSKLMNDAWNVVIGEKTMAQTVMNSQAFFRSMQDSYKMYVRDTASPESN